MIKDAHSERSTERLRAFRRAAERAHDVVERFPDQSFSTRVGAVGRPDELTGLPEDTFVRLTADVRLVFLPQQEAYFDLVYNIVLARLQKDLHEHLAIVKENWKQSIGKGTVFQSLSAEKEINLSIRQGLEALMHGEVFHQDPKLQDGAALIRTLGSLSTVVLQSVVWNLARTMIQLDGFIAYLLHEAPLKRGPKIAEWVQRRAP